MELTFERNPVSCLDTAVREVQNSEQTQEIRLPDGMPDIGHILSSWGQVILRGKEWRSDSISFSGGVMVWVLYAPEEGSAAQCIDAWIPFTMRWDLPEDTPEGEIRIHCLPRFVDARNVSPRKIMVRAGIGAMAEAFVPMTASVSTDQSVPEGVELLRSTYPLRLYQEAGEKAFVMDEELSLPDSIPQPEQIICFRLCPAISDKKVLANKLVFRGNGNLHVLYRSEEGQLHSWDFELPFSQFSELRQEHSTEAAGDVLLCPTSLELELRDDGSLRFKGGLTAQYVITDKQLLELIEDAYSPTRELDIQMEELQLPVLLENRRETIHAQQSIPADANIAVDTVFLPDFPRQRREEGAVTLEIPGMVQILSYGENGSLNGAAARWGGQQTLNADGSSQIHGVPLPSEAQSVIGNGQILAKAEIPMEITTQTEQHLPMVTGLTLGQQRKAEPNRPALILRRAGDERLWDIAKKSGSTVEDIRRANHLQEEPAPNQMLLIPVRG